MASDIIKLNHTVLTRKQCSTITGILDLLSAIFFICGYFVPKLVGTSIIVFMSIEKGVEKDKNSYTGTCHLNFRIEFLIT